MTVTIKTIFKWTGYSLGTVMVAFFGYLFFVDHRAPLVLDTGKDFAGEIVVDVKFKGHKKYSQLVEMSDGIELGVDSFIPAEGETDQEKFPVILKYTPYGRAFIMQDMPLWMRVASKLKTGVWGPVFDASMSKRTRLYLSQGYAYVRADMRGSGASNGFHVPLDPRFAVDGKELVEWIANQPWSNGKVCMEGQSYTGWSQYAIASQKPEALKCISPALIVAETLTEGSRPGGISATSWLERYSDLLANITSHAPDPNALDKFIPVAPVVDEDGDGALDDEVPVGFDGDNPIYSDHDNRTEHFYARGIIDRRQNMLPRDFKGPEYQYIDTAIEHDGRTIKYYMQSPGYMIRDIKDGQMPMYHFGGWFDGFLKGTTKLYATTQHSPVSKMFISPRFHSPSEVTKAYSDYFSYDGSSDDQLYYESLRFFDYHLKGIQNGVHDEKPVKLYVMHEGWREESEWPLARQQVTPFYFREANGLSPEFGTEDGVDAHIVDWTHVSNYGDNQTNRWLMMAAPDGVMDRTDKDPKTFTYDTAKLEADVEVTGHPVVNLWLSSNQPDADVHVYLVDVDENGRSVYVTEGHLRAGWTNLYEDDDQLNGAVDLQPELPWHGHKTDQYNHAPMADGKVVSLKFDLDPTSWVFKKGHKIRVSITGADTGNFEFPEAICPEQDVNNCEETILSFHRSANMRSNIELPIIP